MKYEVINKRYTEIISEWLAKGYYINTATMSGSQGENAKIDLTNGKEIIRILVQSFSDFESDKENDFFINYDGVEILVGLVVDNVRINAHREIGDTVWNHRLEVIHSERYYQIGREKRNMEMWYGNKEEATAATRLNMERYRERNSDRRIERDMPEGAKVIALSYIKRQPKCKSAKIHNIESVKKVTCRSMFNGSTNSYYSIQYKGKEYRIG